MRDFFSHTRIVNFIKQLENKYLPFEEPLLRITKFCKERFSLHKLMGFVRAESKSWVTNGSKLLSKIWEQSKEFWINLTHKAYGHFTRLSLDNWSNGNLKRVVETWEVNFDYFCSVVSKLESITGENQYLIGWLIWFQQDFGVNECIFDILFATNLFNKWEQSRSTVESDQ